jgi:mannan endo-1,4-beta-mannosidase
MKRHFIILLMAMLLTSLTSAGTSLKIFHYQAKDANGRLNYRSFNAANIKKIDFSTIDVQKIVLNDGTEATAPMSELDSLVCIHESGNMWNGSLGLTDTGWKSGLVTSTNEAVWDMMSNYDVLAFDYSLTGSTHQFQGLIQNSANTSDADNLLSDMKHYSGSNAYIEGLESSCHYVKLNPEDLTNMKTYGVLFNGIGLTLTSIHKASNVIWSGADKTLGEGDAWSTNATKVNMIIGSSTADPLNLRNLQVGDKITFHFYSTSGAEFQLIKDSNKDLFSFMTSDYYSVGGSTSFTTGKVTQADIDYITSNGYIMDGHNLVLDFITVTHATPSVALAALDPSKVAASLIDPNATQEAVNVYNFLKSTYGKKTLSGIMSHYCLDTNEMAYWVYNRTKALSGTGYSPAFVGYDFIDGTNGKSAPEEQWNNGGLVGFNWHIRAGGSGFYSAANTVGCSPTTDFDIRKAVTEGTSEYNEIIADIDNVSAYLKTLQDENIPVLWRPLHEAAGDYNNAWFWWGRYGVEYTKQLYYIMYNRMVNYHGLHNLIWVWTMQTPTAQGNGTIQDMKDAYVGDDYCDIVGADIYQDKTSRIDDFNEIRQAIGDKKIIALSECGNIPEPSACYTDGAPWSYFMEWCLYGIDTQNSTADGFGNSDTDWLRIMTDSHVITRDAMPNLKVTTTESSTELWNSTTAGVTVGSTSGWGSSDVTIPASYFSTVATGGKLQFIISGNSGQFSFKKVGSTDGADLAFDCWNKANTSDGKTYVYSDVSSGTTIIQTTALTAADVTELQANGCKLNGNNNVVTSIRYVAP